MVVNKDHIRTASIKLGLLGNNHEEVNTEQFVRLGDKNATTLRVRLLENVDLTGYTFGFDALLPDKKLVRDEDQTRFKHIGRNVFEYKFNDALHGFVGSSDFAYFFFTKADGTRVTTQNFYIRALRNAEQDAQGLQEHYVSVIDDIKEQNIEVFNKAQENIDLINANGVAKKTEFDAFKVEVDGKFAAKSSELDGKISTIDTKVNGFEGRVTATETKNTTQDGRLDGHDNKFTSLEKRVSAFVNVQEFGAMGDNTNSADKIQQALDLAKTKGGVHVHIPAGKYLIEKYMVVYANTKITMDQGTHLIRNHGGGFFKNGNVGDMYTGYDGNGNITIEGGLLDGNVVAIGQYGFNHTGWARGRNLHFYNITFKDVINAHFMDINACDGVRIEKCRFLGYKDITADQSRLFSEAIQISNHTQLGYSDFGVWDGTPTRNVTIRDCYFGHSNTAGMGPVATGIGNHGAVYGVYNSNIKVYDCVFEGMTFAGVRPMKFNDVTIHGCTFTDCQKAISITNPDGNGESGKDGAGNVIGLPQSGRNCSIVNNTFRGSKEEHIFMSAYFNGSNYDRFKNITIENNRFEAQSSQAITGKYSAILSRLAGNLSVKGNVFQDVYRALQGLYNSNLDFSYNKVFNTTTEGIYLSELDDANKNQGYTANTSVTDNYFQDIGMTGIFIQYSHKFNVERNTVVGYSFATDATRNAIHAANTAKDGVIKDNRVFRGVSTNIKYALEVTGSCFNVQVDNNYLEGKLGSPAASVSTANGNFSGIIITKADGTQVRLSVKADGTLETIAL